MPRSAIRTKTYPIETADRRPFKISAKRVDGAFQKIDW